MTDLTTVLYDTALPTDAAWAFVVWVLILMSCTTLASTCLAVVAFRRRRVWAPKVLEAGRALLRLLEAA